MMKVLIEMDMEQISDIVREDLMAYYSMRVEPIGAEDEEDQKALLRVIEMYSSPDQYAEFLERIKDES